MDLREREQHSQRHPWEVARSRFFRRLVRDRCTPLPQRVIDVGSGDGWFAEQLLADLGPSADITCLDVHYTDDDLAADLLAGITRVRTAPSSPAQVVLALDVLEHIADDTAFVAEQLRPLVADGGLLIASVPAHQALFTSHDTALGHHRRHSAASLAALLSPSFEVLHQGSLFTSLLAPRALVAGIERLHAPSGEPAVDSVWRHGPTLTRAITAALSADAAVGRLFADRRYRPPGLSVWAVCKPREQR